MVRVKNGVEFGMFKEIKRMTGQLGSPHECVSPAAKRLLITGASGFLGYHLCRLSGGDEWSPVGTVRREGVVIPGVPLVHGDLTRYDDLTAVFTAVVPDAVVHAAAMSDPNRCQREPEESEKINVRAAVHLAALCAERSIPCVFTSTDLVFGGTKAPYSEEAVPDPVSRYGEQKVRAEEEMRKRCPELIVCRLPLLFGRPGPWASGILQPMVRMMMEGKAPRLFTDEFRTPLDAAGAVRGILLALRHACRILHLGGPERISRYDFGLLAADVLGGKGIRPEPCLRKDIPMTAPRPQDVSLDNRKALALGFSPTPLRESVGEIVADLM